MAEIEDLFKKTMAEHIREVAKSHGLNPEIATELVKAEHVGPGRCNFCAGWDAAIRWVWRSTEAPLPPPPLCQCPEDEPV